MSPTGGLERYCKEDLEAKTGIDWTECFIGLLSYPNHPLVGVEVIIVLVNLYNPTEWEIRACIYQLP